MKRYVGCPIVLAAVLILALSTVIAPSVSAAGDSIVVIVNSSNPTDNLSLSDLKRLFLADRSRWDTGKSVAPVMLGPGPAERTAFLKIVCKMNDEDFKKYFVQAAFEGKDVAPPREVSSARDVKSVVAGSPGAIGFVRAGDFSAGDSGIKPVKVDGASAADPSYKLKM